MLRLPTRVRTGPNADVLPSCLLLALLLHVWLALLIGERISPDAFGRGGWGSLTVTLLGQSGAAPEGKMEAAPVDLRGDGPPGEAKTPRYGGQLRREAPPADSGPGAEKLGRWQQQEVPPEALSSEANTPEPPAATAPELPPKLQAAEPEPAATPATPAPPMPSTETTVLSLPQENAPRMKRLDSVPALKPAAPVSPALRALPTLPNIEPAVEPPPAPQLRTLDAAPAPRPATQLDTLRGARPSAAISQRFTPVPLNAVAPELPAVPEAPQPPAPQPVQPPVPAPIPEPAATPTPLRPPAASPPSPAPAPTPAPTAAPSPAPSLSPAPTPSPASPPALAPGPVTRGDPLALPASGSRATAGAPDAGARVGHDVATAPSASASAPPAPLNLSLPRSGVSAARRGPGMLELLPGLPERKSKIEKAVDEASREDCRKAHSEAGLLAAVPLAIDTVRGKGCKW